MWRFLQDDRRSSLARCHVVVLAYADQAERDHAALKTAVRKGMVQAHSDT